MTETVTTPTTETVVTGTKPVEPEAESQKPTANSQQEEAWDEARARALIDKLRGENRELAKAQKRLTDLEAADKKRSEAEMTELQKTQKELDELRTQLQGEKLARMRQEAATKANLPMEFVERLKGETPEELEADATKVAEMLKKLKPGAPGVNPTNPAATGGGETDEQRRKRLFG
jgi:hypothetical protein